MKTGRRCVRAFIASGFSTRVWAPNGSLRKAKFILYRDREKDEVFNVAVDVAFPDAWTKPPFFSSIKNWVAEGALLGRLVMVHIGTRWVAVLPDRVVELGNIEGDFVLERERDRTGKTIEVRIMPPSGKVETGFPSENATMREC